MKVNLKELAQNKKLLITITAIIAIIIVIVLIGLRVGKGKNGGFNTSRERKSTAKVKTIKGEVYAPEDATIVSDNEEKGIVIKDSNQNEWVWVEVPKDASKVYKTAGLGITEFNNENCQKIRYDLKNYVRNIKSKDQSELGDDFWIQMTDDGTYSKYDPLVSETYDRKLDWFKRTQGCGISYWEYSDLYTDMLKSIYQNGGFYIGRYETGYNAQKDSTYSKEVNQTPVIQQNTAPYNNVTISDAVNLSKKLSTNGLTTSVIFNIQWDLALKHMSVSKNGVDQKKISNDSTDFGNYGNNKNKTITAKEALKLTSSKDKKSEKWEKVATGTKIKDEIILTTGACDAFNAMNIYDMAGNIAELTLGFASDNSPCSIRGGSYNKEGKKCSASFVEGDKNTATYGFRCTLFK